MKTLPINEGRHKYFLLILTSLDILMTSDLSSHNYLFNQALRHPFLHQKKSFYKPPEKETFLGITGCQGFYKFKDIYLLLYLVHFYSKPFTYTLLNYKGQATRNIKNS